MKNVTLIKDYSKLTEAGLDLKGGKIIASLTGNTDFPTTTPSLADFQAKLVSTGFDLASNGDSVPAMLAPTGFKLTDGLNTGEIKSTVRGVAQAIMYSHEYCLTAPDENAVWVTWVTSTVSTLFTDLPSGTRVYVRVGAIGRKDQLVYSDVLSRIVQ
jgi:hypothetical protein